MKNVPLECNLTSPYPIELIKVFNAMPTMNTHTKIALNISNRFIDTLSFQLKYRVFYMPMGIYQSILMSKLNAYESSYQVPDAFENKLEDLMFRYAIFLIKDDKLIYDDTGENRTELKIPSRAVKSRTLVEYRPLPACNETDSNNMIQDVHCQQYAKVHSSLDCWLNNSKYCGVTNCNEWTNVFTEELFMTSSSIPSTKPTSPTEMIKEESTNHSTKPTTISTLSTSAQKQQMLLASHTMNVNMEFRRFTIAWLMPFLLIAGVLCIAFIVFLHNKRKRILCEKNNQSIYVCVNFIDLMN
ncbi:unnamed protein product [Schistosoma turkestanicum]|nr:unnamed protein product [Schistosoma turkestanicum]